jgi:hypothetical protein
MVVFSQFPAFARNGDGEAVRVDPKTVQGILRHEDFEKGPEATGPTRIV